MMKRSALRGTDIYINDHLPTFNSELFRQARQLKRDKKIVSTLLKTAASYAKIREGGEKVKVKTVTDLASL